MFRLNENIIIDATKWGNVSRFINHSCEPNCFCKIVSCDQNLKHIVIFAKRDIAAHEEITYDYQGCTREVVYNDNVLCKYSNLDTTIFKENEKENEKNIRKTVKYKYNINSAMSYRYLMNISSNLRLYVKKSSIHGYGLYTCEFINEGEVKIIFICYIWLERKYILSY
ncbi:hypothetical protein PFNF54_01624 [Plasmodium falciparum NF54]|uniref:[histone H3]-lysine(4) N-trimethyltransferase n=1 Tax=Plasmodium falciparum (isolate NF54) TaxID=5843 RepID=W7JY56_PLAFO|nr:hypothetical protein PFNF54_01624 [Plasmodium falciparum NF54]